MKGTQHFSGSLSSRSNQFNGVTINGTAHFVSEKSKGQGKSRALARLLREEGAGPSHVGEHGVIRSRMIEDLGLESERSFPKLLLSILLTTKAASSHLHSKDLGTKSLFWIRRHRALANGYFRHLSTCVGSKNVVFSSSGATPAPGSPRY
jgi:hypothetical protein